MMKWACATLVFFVGLGLSAAAQECLHGSGESSQHAARRAQALKIAQQINLAEVIQVGPGRQLRRFRPLEDLPNISPMPRGFKIQFHTDGESYLFSIKDTLDPCSYSIFSDQDKRIYEGTPTARSMVVPATGR